MLDHTVDAKLAESVKSDRIDAPARANVLRVEPVCEADDFARQLWIVVAFVVYWGDSEWAGSAMLRTGGKVTPAYEVTAARSLEGAKVVARAFAVDGAIKLGVRVTMGTADDMPGKLDLPTKGK